MRHGPQITRPCRYPTALPGATGPHPPDYSASHRAVSTVSPSLCKYSASHSLIGLLASLTTITPPSRLYPSSCSLPSVSTVCQCLPKMYHLASCVTLAPRTPHTPTSIVHMHGRGDGIGSTYLRCMAGTHSPAHPTNTQCPGTWPSAALSPSGVALVRAPAAVSGEELD